MCQYVDVELIMVWLLHNEHDGITGGIVSRKAADVNAGGISAPGKDVAEH